MSAAKPAELSSQQPQKLAVYRLIVYTNQVLYLRGTFIPMFAISNDVYFSWFDLMLADVQFEILSFRDSGCPSAEASIIPVIKVSINE